MLKYIDPDNALDLVLDYIESLPAQATPIENSLGHILAESVICDRDYPPFDKAMMDGYAVVLEDAGKTIPVVASVAAGEYDDSTEVSSGACVEIMTGAACPRGTEMVVPVEDVIVKSEGVTLPLNLVADKNISRKGSEFSEGQSLSPAGEKVSPLVVANLSFMGYESITAIPTPSIGIIVTGNEVVSGPKLNSPVAIRDSNGPMLESLFGSSCLVALSRTYASDTVDSVLEKLNQYAKRDVITLSGGVSMGKKDLVPEAIAQYGAEILFHKIAQKPGKPMLFAKKGRQLIFALPGNPLSCHLCFHRYISRAVRKLSGKSPVNQGFAGVLTRPVANSGKRTNFVMVSVTQNTEHRFLVNPVALMGSADLFRAVQACAYIRVDPGEQLHEGDLVVFDRFGGDRWMS